MRYLAALVVFATACANEAPAAGPETISARQAADMVYAVLAADREAYTSRVINRLIKEQSVAIVEPESGSRGPLRASEHWRSEPGTLPLPAQMFRMGSETVAERQIGLNYVLLSEWPINSQNRPKTDVELAGLRFVNQGGGAEPYYGTEVLGGVRYLTAVYADVAVAAACVDCHNDHVDSPRNDFEVGDIMGGVVIRVRLD